MHQYLISAIEFRMTHAELHRWVSISTIVKLGNALGCMFLPNNFWSELSSDGFAVRADIYECM